MENLNQEEITAEMFNISEEFEDLQISFDAAGSVEMNVVARRC
jgi:hypothetical protein